MDIEDTLKQDNLKKYYDFTKSFVIFIIIT